MLTHKGTQQIETERLVLRRVTIKDAENIFNNYAADVEVTKFLNFTPHKNINETLEVIQGWLESYETPNFYQWAIEFGGEIIGGISAVAVDEMNESYELGYSIGRNFWGRGITTEAAKAVVDYMFTKINLHRMTSKHDVKNPASGKVMQHVGMRYEGTYKSYYVRQNGDMSDSMVYAILKDEWVGI